MRHAMTLILFLTLGTRAAAVAISHGHEPGKSGIATPASRTEYGSPGNAKEVTRVVELSLRDTMRIEPGRLSVKQGETLRLRIRNKGAVAHEFVLGTQKEILEHRDMMRTMPTMKNDEANAVSVAPGSTAELVWRFDKPGTFLYACLIPGHWEAGMQGTVTVNPVAKPR
jgi:uncharacterized cupredoxin-like copper-binding protein